MSRARLAGGIPLPMHAAESLDAEALNRSTQDTDEKKMLTHSLLHVEENLLAAEYFVRRLSRSRGHSHGFELNAFLSAARSVTFLIEKEMSKVPGFTVWWDARRSEMREVQAMRFFLDMGNYSQKGGRVAIFGQASKPRRWSHWFASGTILVPECLREVEITDACRMHLAKLARLTLQIADAFPAWSCPHRALTPEGIRTLSLDLDELDSELGYERGLSGIDGIGLEGRLLFLRQHFDSVDFDEIRRLSKLRLRRRPDHEPDDFLRGFGAKLRARMHPPLADDL